MSANSLRLASQPLRPLKPVRAQSLKQHRSLRLLRLSAPRIVSSVFMALSLLVAPFTSPLALAAGKVTQHEIKVGDTVRKYMVYRPSSVPRSAPAKVVLAFHGFMSDPAGLRWLTKPDKWADKHKYLMIYPKAVKGSFNAGKGSGTSKSGVDELAFIDALMKRAEKLHNANLSRLYVLGFSNGAQMAALAMCRRAKSLAGMAMVAHSLNIANCKPATPVPSVLIRGAKDPFVPFSGGGRYGLKSHADTVKSLQKYLGLSAEKNEVSVNLPTIRCRDYPKKSSSRLRSCVGFEDGHTWPGGTKFQPEKFGKTNTQVSGYELIFKFFDAQKPAKPPRQIVRAKSPSGNKKASVKTPVTKKTVAKKTARPKSDSSRTLAEPSRHASRGQFSIPLDPGTGKPLE